MKWLKANIELAQLPFGSRSTKFWEPHIILLGNRLTKCAEGLY